MAWIEKSATEIAAAIKSKQVSASEVMIEQIAAIKAKDEAIGSYILVDEDSAFEDASKIDAKIAAGDSIGPLAGVPVGLKDVLVTKGMETTAASQILKGFIPPYDGTAVKRMKDAGMVLIGKLNCDEFAMGSSNENSSVKPCRNPWDTNKVPGGSSGGSAAAVAANLTSCTLGTDTGGSIRQPASLCGIVGVKPTYGRVSRYGVVAFASSLDQVGPMTKTVEDAALLLEVIGGFDPNDATSLNQPLPDLRKNLESGVKGLRIGIVKEFTGVDGVEAGVEKAVQQGIDCLKQAGAEIVEISLPHVKYSLPTYYLVAPAEASSNLSRYDGIRYGNRIHEKGQGLEELYMNTRGQGFGPEVKRRIMLGTFALRSGFYDAYYRKAQQLRTLIAQDYDKAFDKVDVIVSPASPTTAFGFGEKTKDPVSMYLSDVYTLSCNLAGIPGMSVPCGFSGGMPVGMQILAPALQEPVMFQVARHIEKEIGNQGKTPKA